MRSAAYSKRFHSSVAAALRRRASCMACRIEATPTPPLLSGPGDPAKRGPRMQALVHVRAMYLTRSTTFLLARPESRKYS